MAEVVCSNFSALLPHIEECIKKSEFLAVDTEFTGFTARPEDESTLFDTIEQRYQKMKRFAQTFTICQFGLSVFIKDPKANKYVAHTFSFYLCPRQQGSVDFRLGFQASNIEFLCEHRFDFNKLFYEGIPYLNGKQEKELLASRGTALGEKELQEALGFISVFRMLVKAKKPLLGHNMLNDLLLMFEKFYEPLPERYAEFKEKLHALFPVIIDTKNLCHGLKKQLSRTNLLGFSSLVDLYDALGSHRGTFYALCTPDVCHAEESQKYNSQRSFHEAGFDAFCVGFIFLRIAHLVAMKDVKSSEAHPVHVRQYFSLMEPYTNKVNLIRGPFMYINLSGPDPSSSRSEWLIATSRTGEPFSTQTLQDHLGEFGSMDVQFSSPNTAVIVLTSRRRSQQVLEESRQNPFLCVRRYMWLRDSLTAQKIIWRFVLPGLSLGVVGTAVAIILHKL